MLVLLSVVFLAWLIWFIGNLEPFRYCIHQRKNYQAYQALHKETLFIVRVFVRAELNSVCVGHVTNVYQAPITALSGLVVAMFTGTLWWVTRRAVRATEIAADAARKGIELARIEFISSHRPRLAIRNVVLTQDESHWRAQQGITIGEIPRGQLYVVNTGGSEALITDAMVMIHTQEKSVLPMERPYEGQHGNMGRFSAPLLAGQSVPIPFASDRPISDDQTIRILEGAGGFLYVMGWVEYRSALYDIGSDSHVVRRTAFCRVFNAETGRFVRVNDEDYEHEE